MSAALVRNGEGAVVKLEEEASVAHFRTSRSGQCTPALTKPAAWCLCSACYPVSPPPPAKEKGCQVRGRYVCVTEREREMDSERRRSGLNSNNAFIYSFIKYLL